MVFGKKRRLEEIAAPIQEDDFDDSVMHGEVQNLEDDMPNEDESQQSSKFGKQQKLLDPQSKPLLDEIILVGAAQGKNLGGSKTWSCKHCKNKFMSSYTRIHYHFFGAPPGKKAKIQRCTMIMKNREEYERIGEKVQDAEKAGVAPSLKNSTFTRRHAPSKPGSIEAAFSIMERHDVDVAVLKALCANGIPFNVLRNPQWHEMVSAINRAPKGYKAPSFEKARTTLLDEVKRNIEKEMIPVKDTWYSHGVSIVSDGWTNVKHQPLINIIAANSRGAMFLYAEDFAGIEKSGKTIAQFLLQAIEEVGTSNVLQVVTDNAANCKLAGKEVEKVHKHIFWSPCVVHTLNLIFKDLAKQFEWFQNTYKRGKLIVKYFVNHNHALTMFRTQSKLELLKVAKTRFASHYILLKRLVDCREALATTVILRTWKDWVKTGDEHTRTLGSLVTQTIGTEDFWDDVENILAITKPIYFLIKFCDDDGPKMGEIYERMDNILGQIKDSMKEGVHFDKYPKVEEIVLGRWEKMNIPMHCLGFALTPRFYDQRYLAMPTPGGTVRKSPNQDKEVIMGVTDAFAKIAKNATEAKLSREQFPIFHMRKGLYATAAAQADAVTMDAINWWSTYGSETPELAEVARKDGLFKKWDIDPEHTNVDDSIVRLEDLRWKALDGDYVDAEDDPIDKDDELTEVPASMPTASTRATPSEPPMRRTGLQQSRISNFVTGNISKDKGKAKQ